MIDAIASGEDDGLGEVRRSYAGATLVLTDLSPDERSDPLLVLRRWLDDAVRARAELEPTAMVLATVAAGADGPAPDARVVLCKGIDTGVVFYSHATSAKGRQVAATPVAAVVFHWATLQRQLRVRGHVTPLTDAESDAYFATRPRGSQLGAWASTQSAPIADRSALERAADAVAARFADRPVPRPPTWGGFRVVPDELELWQGRPDRLHDRLLASRGATGWSWTRLQP